MILQAAVDPNGSDEERARRVLAHVRWAMPGMLTALTTAVHQGRSGARAEAREDLATHVHPDALERRGHPSDSPRAYAAAAGLVSAWGATALFKIGQWRSKTAANSNARPLAAELRDTTELLRKRLERTAATETIHAFNETRGAIMVAHADVHETISRFGETRRRPGLFELPPPGEPGEAPPPPPGGSQGPYREAAPVPPTLRPLKVWSAILDGHVCAVCRKMHGTVVDPRDEFPGGDPPRHPFCRCIPVIIMTTLRANEVERAYEELAA